MPMVSAKNHWNTDDQWLINMFFKQWSSIFLLVSDKRVIRTPIFHFNRLSTLIDNNFDSNFASNVLSVYLFNNVN